MLSKRICSMFMTLDSAPLLFAFFHAFLQFRSRWVQTSQHYISRSPHQCVYSISFTHIVRIQSSVVHKSFKLKAKMRKFSNSIWPVAGKRSDMQLVNKHWSKTLHIETCKTCEYEWKKSNYNPTRAKPLIGELILPIQIKFIIMSGTTPLCKKSITNAV